MRHHPHGHPETHRPEAAGYPGRATTCGEGMGKEWGRNGQVLGSSSTIKI